MATRKSASSDGQTWTIPNTISSLRIVGAFPVMLLVGAGAAENDPRLLWAALALMILAEFSDWLDGHLARTRGWISSIGKVLDPMADCLFHIALFIAFVAAGWMPLWMLVTILSREILVSYLRLFAEERRETLASRSIGKWKAAIQGGAQIVTVAIHALWAGAPPPEAELAILALLGLATAITAYSLVDYVLSVVRAGR